LQQQYLRPVIWSIYFYVVNNKGKTMSELWDLGNKVSEIGYRLDGIKCVAAMLGEAMSDDVNSGVAWTISEMVDKKGQELEELSAEIMRVGREKDVLIAKYEALIDKYKLKKKKNTDIDGRC